MSYGRLHRHFGLELRPLGGHPLPEVGSSLERLDAYARQFRTVEVNNTFYRWPKDEVFSTWRERSPDGFVFSAKASRGLTQFRKLNDPVPWLERMEAGLSRLDEKRGVTLFQLPPHFPLQPRPARPLPRRRPVGPTARRRVPPSELARRGDVLRPANATGPPTAS